MLELLTSTFLSIPLIGAFSLFAIGIVVIYRASRVLNLAHGAMAMLPAYVNYSLVEAGVPVLAALPVAIAVGALLGVGVERVFVRRLRPQGPTAQTVGTVAVTALAIAVVARVWGTTPILAPPVFPDGVLELGGSAVRYGDLGLLAVGTVVSAAMFAFFKYSEFGLAMRGAAQNRAAASLMGIDPNRAAAAAWALGGGLAALAGVLLAAVTNLDPYTLSLQVLPAFVAALLGGLEAMAGALVGAVIVGLMYGLVPLLAQLPVVGAAFSGAGAVQLALTVLALVVMAVRGRRVVGVEAAEAGLTGGQRSGGRMELRNLVPGAMVALALLVVWPFVAPYSALGSTLLALEFALVAVSLVVLTGWVGQISLAQGTFVGIGALTTAIVARSVVGFPASVLVGAAVAGLAAVAFGMVALRVRGLYLAVATLIFAWMGQTYLFRAPWMGASGGSSTIPNEHLGAPGTIPSFDLTARVPLYFILLTALVLVIAAMANLRDTRTGRAFFAVRGSEMAASSLGIDIVRVKLIAFAIGGVIAGLGGSLLMYEQRTVVPDQFFVTASLQFLAIAVVGGLTSLGGAVAAGLLFAGLNELFFRVEALGGLLDLVSAGLLAFVLLAAPGGLGAAPDALRRQVERMRATPSKLARRRLATAQRAAADAAGQAEGNASADDTAELDLAGAGYEAPPRGRLALAGAWLGARPPVRLIASSGRAVLRRVAAPVRTGGGSGAVPDRPEDWFSQIGAQSEPAPEPAAPEDDEAAASEVEDAAEAPALATGNGFASRFGVLVARPTLPPDRADRLPLLEADQVTVRFGGLTAVDDVSISVREGEIVGLIGPNGAGKTTLFNAILGLNDPAEGQIRLYGRDVTALPPHLRARLGVARTFQVLQLFNELTTAENLLVATHLHNDAGVLSNLVASPRTVRAETAARERVDWVLDLLDLGEVAAQPVRNLPFGILRMVELGRSLVTGARLLMLDEAASGLNDAETAHLVAVVRAVRDLGVSVLLIEHDVRMVTGVSDYVYVLDQGKLIADGTPAQIQRAPEVIAAYIGGADDAAGEPGRVDAEVGA